MNYGQLRLRIQQQNPGTDLGLIDGYIQNRYTEILDFLPWKRMEAESVLQSPASYTTGTVSVTAGSTAITGAGTNWDISMSGRMIRIAATDEYYQFTPLTTTTGVLDRGYEQPNATAQTYRIDQAVFVLPSDCRLLRNVKPLHDADRPLLRRTPGELDALAGQRTVYGTPRYYAPTWDSFSDPPRMQVELYPIPDSPNASGAQLSWVADYVFDAADLTPGTTSSSLLPWIRPAALEAGVKADILRLAKDYQGAEVYDGRFKELLGSMARTNAQQRGAQTVQMAPGYRRRQPAGQFYNINRPWDGE